MNVDVRQTVRIIYNYPYLHIRRSLLKKKKYYVYALASSCSHQIEFEKCSKCLRFGCSPKVRWWNQFILWLENLRTHRHTDTGLFKCNSSNILLGEKGSVDSIILYAGCMCVCVSALHCTQRGNKRLINNWYLSFCRHRNTHTWNDVRRVYNDKWLWQKQQHTK